MQLFYVNWKAGNARKIRLFKIRFNRVKRQSRASGPRGRRFKSCRSDQINLTTTGITASVVFFGLRAKRQLANILQTQKMSQLMMRQTGANISIMLLACVSANRRNFFGFFRLSSSCRLSWKPDSTRYTCGRPAAAIKQHRPFRHRSKRVTVAALFASPAVGDQ